MRDLKTEKQRNQAVADLKSVLLDPGWDLIVEITKENIKALERRIIKKGDFTEEQLDGFRQKVESYRDVIEAPRRMIKKLRSGVQQEEINYDPYYTKEDFETVAEKSKKANT